MAIQKNRLANIGPNPLGLGLGYSFAWVDVTPLIPSTLYSNEIISYIFQNFLSHNSSFQIQILELSKAFD